MLKGGSVMHTDEEFEAMRAEIESLKKQLAQSGRDQNSASEYMSHLAHEIRTPMNSVIQLARVGMDESYGRTASEYFQKIKKAAEYQLEIINDVLDMARLNRGFVTLCSEPCAIRELADELCAVITPLTRKKQIELNADIHDMLAETIMTDRLRLKQILMNLLSNASKFTNEGGNVCLEIFQQAAQEDMVRTIFKVRDNGVGMSEEFLDRIFEPFTQEKNAASVQGTGLGMSISKDLAKLMGGDLNVVSKLGEGSEFTVEMVTPAAEDPSAENTAGERGGFDLSGKRALVVDDHSINRIYEVKLLNKAGVECEAAVNGSQGLDIFASSGVGHFDVILMDITMPVMDGLEAASRIRSLERADAETVKIIGMSANSYPEDIRASKEAGMNAHLGKPVSEKTLISAVAAVFDE